MASLSAKTYGTETIRTLTELNELTFIGVPSKLPDGSTNTPVSDNLVRYRRVHIGNFTTLSRIPLALLNYASETPQIAATQAEATHIAILPSPGAIDVTTALNHDPTKGPAILPINEYLRLRRIANTLAPPRLDVPEITITPADDKFNLSNIKALLDELRVNLVKDLHVPHAEDIYPAIINLQTSCGPRLPDTPKQPALVPLFTDRPDGPRV